MNRYILDTDHLTLLKRNHPIVRAKIGSISPTDIFVTIVTSEGTIRFDSDNHRWARQLRARRDAVDNRNFRDNQAERADLLETD